MNDGRQPELLQRASREWRSSLIDVSGNNRLLYFRPTASNINLDDAPTSAIERLLSGATVRLAELVADPTNMRAAQRACASLARKQREAREEYGVSVAFLAVGLATWNPDANLNLARAQAAEIAPGSDEGRRPAYTHPSAPVLLRPLELTLRRGAQEVWELRLEEDFQFNGVLQHVLQAAAVNVDDDQILQNDDGTAEGVRTMLELLEEACGDVTGFKLDPTYLLGAFSYQKQPMVADIDNLAALAGSDLVAALAGDAGAAARVRTFSDDVQEPDPDWKPVESEYLVLDADSSQSFVVNAALAGRNLVVQGPPGTGKSQTIANVIATMVANGKSVLFVAQKRAAIAAVLDRLNGVDLGHLVLDMFASTGSRRFIAEELRNVLDMQKTIGIPNVEDLHYRHALSRDQLVQHSEEMKKGRGWGVVPEDPTSGVNVTWLRAESAGLPTGARSALRLPIAVFAAWHRSALAELATALNQLEALGALDTGWRTTPGWSPDALTTRDQVEEQGERARTLAQFTIPALRKQLAEIAAEAGWGRPTSWVDLETLIRYMADIRWLTEVAAPLLSTGTSSEGIEDMLALTDKQYRRATNRKISWSRRRAGMRAIKEILPGAKRIDAHSTVLRAKGIRTSWAGTQDPRVPASFAAAEAAAESVRAALDQVQAAVQNLTLKELDVDECQETLVRLAGQANRGRMPIAYSYEVELANSGLQPVVDEIRTQIASGVPLQAPAGDILRWIAVRSVLEYAEATSPVLAMATGLELNRTVREFQATEVQKLSANAARVRRLAAENLRATLDSHSTEHSILRGEVNRKRNLRAVRTLFREAPHVMLAAKPVWAMSPLQVSRLLPARKCFDVVIFDEASQVKPADAIPSLIRAGQALVAGDKQQLPPTDFFTKVLEDESASEEGDYELGALDASIEDAPTRAVGSATHDMESILVAMDSVLGGQGRMLQWHYRSRDDRLIAVSNAGLYFNALTTFPSADAPDTLRHVAVAPSAGVNGTANSPQGEVARVVELVREHIKEHPDESLGVITFGVKHQGRIEQALEAAAREDTELRALYNRANEPFFVKSIERVQGDERDAIILSIGYGKGLDGKLRYLWGPLLQDGGERRLNVAISRARRRMTLVTSFSVDDVPDDGHPSSGFRLMYRFLRYMASDGKDVRDGPDRNVVLNPFEIDVRDRLIAAGLQLDPQVGAGEYRIDFAVRHPDLPGRYVLAIEADGANYHGTHTARERDRLRQMLLEARGWTFHRIWSTDWFNDPDREVANVLAAFENALENSGPAGPPALPDPDEEDGWHVEEPLRQSPRPTFRRGLPITDYPHRLLVALIEHYRSDGVLRTADEEIALAMNDLGFQRRGPRIVDALDAAMRGARRP